MELLRSLLASKRVVLSGMDGLRPASEIAGACGWDRHEVADRGDVIVVWDLPQGATRIGWIDDEWIYLDPNAAHAAVERMAGTWGRLSAARGRFCRGLPRRD